MQDLRQHFRLAVYDPAAFKKCCAASYQGFYYIRTVRKKNV